MGVGGEGMQLIANPAQHHLSVGREGGICRGQPGRHSSKRIGHADHAAVEGVKGALKCSSVAYQFLRGALTLLPVALPEEPGLRIAGLGVERPDRGAELVDLVAGVAEHGPDRLAAAGIKISLREAASAAAR